MNPGLELDIKITKKIFGSFTKDPDCYKTKGETLFYYSESRNTLYRGVPYKLNNLTEEEIKEFKGKIWNHMWHSFKPSTVFSDSWIIVTELRNKLLGNKDYSFQLIDDTFEDGRYAFGCRFLRNSKWNLSVSPELCICLAALDIPKEMLLTN